MRIKRENDSALPSSAIDFLNEAIPAALLSKGPDGTRPSREHFTYIHFLVQRIDALFKSPLLITALVPVPDGVNTDSVFLIMKHIVQYSKCNELTIDGAITHLIICQDLRSDCADGALQDHARIVVFAILGWMLMLYPPFCQKTLDTSQLRIDSSQTPCLFTCLSFSKCRRPIWENIQSFGDLLPSKGRDGETLSTGSLHVSNLNASTLRDIGGISISWVTCLNAHLTLDVENRRLRVFALPSFCAINLFEDTALARVINECYDENSRPKNFTSSAYLKEVRLSYRLLFSDSTRSKRLYQRKERKKALAQGLHDPLLDDLCSLKPESTTFAVSRASYNVTSDFPILGGRLFLLQDYIERQQPSTVVALWKDRRDLLRFYTFWAVAIVGGFSLLFSLVQILLSAEQVNLALAGQK